jgi:hypothetical protein
MYVGTIGFRTKWPASEALLQVSVNFIRIKRQESENGGKIKCKGANPTAQNDSVVLGQNIFS